jgi:hypothetical protein
MKDKKRDAVLSQVDPSRRDFLQKAAGASFIVPVVASFTMSGLMARPASAQANQTETA